MNFLSDLLLVAAALGAAVYCFVLSRRLSALGKLEGGIGSAIAVLSTQVDDLTHLLKTAQSTAGQAGSKLDDQTSRAENVAKRLELLMASMHDLPAAAPLPAERSPTRWPVEAASHTRPDPTEPVGSTPMRARVLRRRRDPEAN